MLWLVVLLVAVVAGVVLAAWIWNGLVRACQGVHEAWAQIEVLLDRRHRLIADLAAIAGATADFERSTLERLTQARGLRPPPPPQRRAAKPRRR